MFPYAALNKLTLPFGQQYFLMPFLPQHWSRGNWLYSTLVSFKRIMISSSKSCPGLLSFFLERNRPLIHDKIICHLEIKLPIAVYLEELCYMLPTCTVITSISGCSYFYENLCCIIRLLKWFNITQVLFPYPNQTWHIGTV